MNEQEILLNENAAYDLITSTEDAIERTLLEIAFAKLRMRLIHFNGMSVEEYQRQLPKSPVDTLFYITLVKSLFENRDKIKRILDGEIEAANDFPID